MKKNPESSPIENILRKEYDDRRAHMIDANSRQVGGAHYSKPIQHWDYAAANNFDYFQGQITKYIARWRDKNGIEDLEKAAHFLQKYIEVAKQKRIEGEPLDPPPVPLSTPIGTRAKAWAGYVFEGAKGMEWEMYTCDRCRDKVYVVPGGDPERVHGSCPSREYLNPDTYPTGSDPMPF